MKYLYSKIDEFNCDININDLLQVIDQNKERFNNSIVDDFMDNWKKAFYNCYSKEVDNIYYLKSSNYFRESIFINEHEMRLHFDIDKAKKLSLLYQSYPLPSCEFEEFSMKNINFDASIKFTIPNELNFSYNYCECQEPVLIVPFCHGGFFYLVIDGNHRIAARKKFNFEYIDGIILNIQDAVSILSSNFEVATYLFLYEGFLLAQNDFSIINNSNAKFFI